MGTNRFMNVLVVGASGCVSCNSKEVYLQVSGKQFLVSSFNVVYLIKGVSNVCY